MNKMHVGFYGRSKRDADGNNPVVRFVHFVPRAGRPQEGQ